jgi:hypothetical protein
MSEDCCAKKILKGEKSILFQVFDRIGSSQKPVTLRQTRASFHKEDTLNIIMEGDDSSNNGD